MRCAWKNIGLKLGQMFYSTANYSTKKTWRPTTPIAKLRNAGYIPIDNKNSDNIKEYKPHSKTNIISVWWVEVLLTNGCKLLALSASSAAAAAALPLLRQLRQLTSVSCATCVGDRPERRQDGGIEAASSRIQIAKLQKPNQIKFVLPYRLLKHSTVIRIARND